MTRAAVLVAVCLLVAASCGGDDDGGGDTPLTVGQACNSIGTSWCARGFICALPGSGAIDECEFAFLTACCVNAGLCQREANPQAPALVSACVRALATYDCQALAAGALPAACVGAAKPEEP